MEVTTREQLLDGLQYVHGILERMQRLMSQYIHLEREYAAKIQYTGLKQHTEEIKTDTAKSKSKLIIITISLTIAIFYWFLSFVFRVDGSSAILFLVPIAIMIFANKKPKLKIVATLFEVFMILWFFATLIKSAPPVLAIVILVLLGIVIAGETIFIKNYNGRYVVGKNREADKHNKAIMSATDAKNAEIEQYNQSVSARRNELYNKYADLRDELLANTSDWFPPDYYNMTAVEHFIESVRNHKASTVKEMVSLFDESQYREEVRAYQREQSQKLDTLIHQNEDIKQNQEEEKRLLKTSNLLQFMGLGQRAAESRRQDARMQNYRSEADQTRNAINRNTDALRDLLR